MRPIRFALGLAGVAAVTVPAGAQSSELFRDSWFWGAKAGVMSLSTPETPRTARPTYGVEWLITRSVAALYVSADIAHFNVIGTIPDPAAPEGRRAVEAKNMRRVGFTALAFPRTFGAVRPYAGLGLSLNVIGSARLAPDTSGVPAGSGLEGRIDDARSRAAMHVMAGAQAQYRRVVAFAQVTAMPGSTRFLLDESSTQFIEFGIRYRVGSSMDRPGRSR